MDVQYATLWLFSSGQFRYINCWPGCAWFSVGGRWHEEGSQLHCQGSSRKWSDGFADNHTNRDYATVYTSSEDKQQLVSDKQYLSPLTKVSPDTVALFFSQLSERELPQYWRNFQELMWKIKKVALETFLNDRGSRLTLAGGHTMPVFSLLPDSDIC